MLPGAGFSAPPRMQQQGERWMKKHLSNLMLALVFIAGLSLLLYPTVADWWNSRVQSRAVVDYNQSIARLDTVSYQQYWNAAESYNQRLMDDPMRFHMDDAALAEYNSILNVTGNGIIGRIKIAKLNIEFPIYHTTRESVLQIAIGHIEGTSLPTGGAGTHCALSGHRGLPSARLFTDLDKMEIGDTFVLYVLDRTLTYEVDQILVVEPTDMSALEIDPEQDYCTLVTCTPYGINSHRLLVRGHRVDNVKTRAKLTFTSDAEMIDPLNVALTIGAPVILLWMVWMMIAPRKKK